MCLEKVKDLWVDVKYKAEDHPFLAWVLVGVVGAILVFGGVNLLGSNESSELVQVETELNEDNSETRTYDEIIGVEEETVHILTNPDQYTDDVVDRAYHESLITFDNQFVKDNTFLGTDLENGVYLYHEKANDAFVEVANLAVRVRDLGVPIKFYTPQLDQSIASLSNHTAVVENGEVNVYAVIVRNDEVDEKITSIEGVISYLGGVIDANTE